MKNHANSENGIAIRLRILRGVTRPIDTMSVDEICRNAGVSRQTFYNYFESKYLLRSWWSQYCERFFLDRIGIDLSWEEGLIRHVQMMLMNSDFLFRTTMNHGSEERFTEGETVARRIAAIEAALTYRNIDLTKDLSFLVDVYARDFVSRAEEFFREEAESNWSITAISSRFVSIVPALLYDSLQIEPYSNYSQLENYRRMDEIARTILDKPLTVPFILHSEV